MIELLEKHVNGKTKKPRGPIAWSFLTSVEYDAGGKFMPQHSGIEQTNKHGMNMMENFAKICQRVRGACIPDCDSSSLPSQARTSNAEQPMADCAREEMETQTWIKENFTKFERFAETLSPLLRFLKRQEKACADELKELIYEFTVAWDDAFPDKKAFNKFHFLVAHMPDFVELWGMLGILSEESFEAYHSHSAKVKNILKSNPNHEQRVATFNARSQNLLKRDIMDLTLLVEDQTTGKKTGTQTNKKKLSPDNSEHVLTRFPEKTIDGIDFFVLDCGALIPLEWKDIYLWYSSSKAPKAWRDTFFAAIPSELTEVQEQSAQYSKF